MSGLKMTRTPLVIAALAWSALSVLVTTPVQASTPSGPSITITGQASVTAAPDTAVISLQVRTHKDSAQQAKSWVDQHVNQFLEAMVTTQINKDDIVASSLSVRPNTHYKDGIPELQGYWASRNLTVTLKDLNLLNSVLDQALQSGIHEIGSIQLTSSQTDQLEKKALDLAIQDAKDRATYLAQSFDSQLGAIYFIDANQSPAGFMRAPSMMLQAADVMSSEKSTAGQYFNENMSFDARVQVVFELKPIKSKKKRY